MGLVRSWEFFIPPQQVDRSPKYVPFTGSLHTSQIPPSPRSTRQAPSPLIQAFDLDPRRILRRRSSLVVDDLPADFKRHSLTDDAGILEELEPTNGVNGKPDGIKIEHQDEKSPVPLSSSAEKKKPTQFEEPDANNLLDVFGF
jgi:hypothetical protein